VYGWWALSEGWAKVGGTDSGCLGARFANNNGGPDRTRRTTLDLDFSLIPFSRSFSRSSSHQHELRIPRESQFDREADRGSEAAHRSTPRCPGNGSLLEYEVIWGILIFWLLLDRSLSRSEQVKTLLAGPSPISPMRRRLPSPLFPTKLSLSKYRAASVKPTRQPWRTDVMWSYNSASSR